MTSFSLSLQFCTVKRINLVLNVIVRNSVQVSPSVTSGKIFPISPNLANPPPSHLQVFMVLLWQSTHIINVILYLLVFNSTP